MNSTSRQRLQRRRKRVRAKVTGTDTRPRLTVFRSLRHLTAQVINDVSGQTLVSARDTDVDMKGKRKLDVARDVGKLLAERARAVNIAEVVFDRGGRAYHGRVQAFAEGAREGGLLF